MSDRPVIHVVGPCYAPNGGALSMLAIMDSLADRHALEFWHLTPDVDADLAARLSALCRTVHPYDETMRIPCGAHVLFYPSELATLATRIESLMRPAVADAASVQTVVTFNIGALLQYDWLAAKSSCVYFEDSDTAGIWHHVSKSNAWRSVDTVVLTSPVDTAPFLDIPARDADPLVIGRLAGHQPLPMDAGHFYQQLSRRLPEAEFWFMPAPEVLSKLFAKHPRFRFYDEGAMPAAQFLEGIDIFCLPVKHNTSMHGPRVLVEAMAAGRAPVTVAWQGPKDRIEHGVSGFLAENLDEMARHVVALATDSALRRRVGEAARRRAMQWKAADWADAISAHCVQAPSRQKGAGAS